ncbi:MAG: dihydrofolate reductase family protein [Brachybacterium sp.]|uniref:dihydrofolate reductase family protein n=1 Tax=Brachybacterium sp. TaxID=1891286 RepID=UPI00264A3A3C|nr:dihydrofolate reductase family protein [Brachybacterium sp.]MDN5688601.1 dihydrofolate reductase family protein [Brachybacterium sp.]
MHLLLRDGEPLPAPHPLGDRPEAARTIADLYALPALPSGSVHVRAMMNATLDGAIHGADGTSGPLRNPDDSLVFGVLRALTDVVLVGAGTVRVEDYSSVQGREGLLSPSRRPGGAARPALAVWSNSGDLPPTLDRRGGFYLITSPEAAADAGRRAGADPEQVIPAATPAAAIHGLAARGLRAIQAEGGPSALGQLAAAGLLDELCLSTTHRTVGGPSSRVLHGPEHDQGWQQRSLLVGEHATIARYHRGR